MQDRKCHKRMWLKSSFGHIPNLICQLEKNHKGKHKYFFGRELRAKWR